MGRLYNIDRMPFGQCHYGEGYICHQICRRLRHGSRAIKRIFERHFPQWLSAMPALDSLDVCSSTIFSATRVRDGLRSCKRLKSLSIRKLEDDKVNEYFPSVLSALAGDGLERLVLQDCRYLSLESLEAINTFHANSLRELELTHLSFSVLSLLSSGFAGSITNLRSCRLQIESLIDMEPPSSQNRKDIADFLRQNKALEILHIRASGPDDLVPLFLDDLNLKSLTLDEVETKILKSERLWRAIVSQAHHLRSLVLSNEVCLGVLAYQLHQKDILVPADSRQIPKLVCDSIRALKKLKVLSLKTVGLSVSGMDLVYILLDCHDLEEIEIGTLGYILEETTIESLMQIERPLRLRKLWLMYRLGSI
jgi:hypothetical protein